LFLHIISSERSNSYSREECHSGCGPCFLARKPLALKHGISRTPQGHPETNCTGATSYLNPSVIHG
jgi:hypothetical protein